MNRYLLLTEKHSTKFLTAVNNSMKMRLVTAKLGQVVDDESIRDMTSSEVEETISQALLRGFREVSGAEFSACLNDVLNETQNAAVEQDTCGGIMTSWQNLKHENKRFLHNDPEEYLPNKLQMFCVHDEPCSLESDLKLAFDSEGPTAQTAQRNLVFNQGLMIDGNFDAGAFVTSLPQIVIVKGDLRARNLILTGWLELVVTGDVIVEGIVFGYDGEAGGRLAVQGSLVAQRVLGGMMFNIGVEHRVDAAIYWTDDDEPTLPKATTIPGTLSSEQAAELDKHSPVVREAYFASSNWASGEEIQSLVLDPSQIVTLIRGGKRVFSDSSR